MRARAWRLPMLLLIPVLLVVGLTIEGHSDGATPGAAAAPVDGLAAVAPAEGSLGSTWYCPAGSATGDPAGIAEQVVVIANLSDQPIEVAFTAYVGVLATDPAREQGAPVALVVPVPANGRVPVRVSDVVKAPWASVLVEVQGGRVVVEQVLTGPQGRTVAQCASRPSSTWYFPAGTTRAGTSEYIALFNPFPDEASVDITFETEEGARTPEAFRGLIVPGSSTSVVPIGAVTDAAIGAALKRQVATTVVARNGRIVAEQLLVSDGTPTEFEDPVTGAVDPGLTSVGLAATVGAPAPGTTWVFPAVTAPADGVTASISVMNPTDRDTEVEVQVFLDQPELNGSVEPFVLSIPRGRYETKALFDGRIPPGVGGWALVQSTDGVPVVAQLLEEGIGSAEPGIATVMGSPVVASDWVLAAASIADLEGTSLSIVNPAAVGEVRVRLVGRSQGVEVAIPGGEIVVLAGTRVPIDMAIDGRAIDELILEVVGDAPIVVSRRFVFGAADDIAVTLGLPVAGTLRAPVDLARPVAVEPDPPVTEGSDVTQPTAGDGGTAPDDSASTTTASTTPTTTATTTG